MTSGGRRGWLAITAAAAAGAGLFAYKMRSFWGLETTSDLYLSVQFATSWLDGRLLHDNLWGNQLSSHSFFFCLLLAPFAYWFGAPGLLFVLALVAALSVIAIDRILRLHDINPGIAAAAAVFLVAMPLSAHTYQHLTYAFNPELLEPALALWLGYFLLRRHWTGSMALTLALVSVKEDAPLLAIAIAAAVLLEQWLRNRRKPEATEGALNRPALASLVLGCLSIPVLLHIIKSQPVVALDEFARLGNGGISGTKELTAYVAGNVGNWLVSPTTGRWLGLALLGSGALVLLRPHLLLPGLVTTLISWLLQDNLTWPPRFAPSLGYIQFAAALCFVAAVRFSQTLPTAPRTWLSLSAAAATFALQLRVTPEAARVYRLDPPLAIGAAERAQADALFGRYRRESRRDEPVIASEFLFRFAHDRPLYWYTRLSGRPKPEWILWDTAGTPLSVAAANLRNQAGTDLSHYHELGREGRFVLYRRRSDADSLTVPSGTIEVGPETPTLTDVGGIRLVLAAPSRAAGIAEPLVVVGGPGDAHFAFARFVAEDRVRVGVEFWGFAAFESEPIAISPGEELVIEVHLPALYPHASDPRWGAVSDPVRADARSRYAIKVAGRTELEGRFSAPFPRDPKVSIGRNPAGGSLVANLYSGKVLNHGRIPLSPP